MNYHYLIVALSGSEVEGYYLLDDSEMEKADRVHEDSGTYWTYLLTGTSVRLDSAESLMKFIQENDIHVADSFGCTPY